MSTNEICMQQPIFAIMAGSRREYEVLTFILAHDKNNMYLSGALC